LLQVTGTALAESGVLFLEAFDQVVDGLVSGDRGYERLLSRNQPPAMNNFPRNMRVITDGHRAAIVKPGNPGHDKAKV
jgi:hypothetical protein